MSTKTFILPRNEFSLFAIQQIGVAIPCSFPSFEEMMEEDSIYFKITCMKYNMNIVEAILKRYGVLQKEEKK